MRWQTVVLALALGMIGGAGWQLWDQRQETQAAATTAPDSRPPEPSGPIRLIVQHDGGALRLRWSTKAPGIQEADHGTLTVTDGEHTSRLQLDGKELKSGLASWWPEASRVGFRLETDTGASASIEAPVVLPANAKAEPGRPQPVAKNAAPARHRSKMTASSYRGRIDDGLEWTQQPRRDSRWSRFKKKMPFWRKPAADE